MDYLAYLQNNVLAIAVFVSVFIAFYILRTVLILRLAQLSKATKNDFDDLAVNVLKTIHWLFATLFSVYVAFAVSGYNFFEIRILSVIFITVVTYQVDRALRVIFEYSVRKFTDDEHAAKSVNGLKTIVSIGVWVSGLLFVLASLGFNINSLIAGLGIGGLAVALALQNILGDIFSSFTIFLDRPFKVGDYILVSSHEGTVEKIGLKTTRIRTPRGEEVVISNKTLTESEIQNFGSLTRRRTKMVLGFEYETPSDKLEMLPRKLEELIQAFEGVTFDRMVFREFADFSLLFDFTYYIHSNQHKDFQQYRHEIGLKMKRLFEEMGVNLAYPTETVYEKNIQT